MRRVPGSYGRSAAWWWWSCFRRRPGWLEELGGLGRGPMNADVWLWASVSLPIHRDSNQSGAPRSVVCNRT